MVAPLVGGVLFGWSSGIFAIFLAVKRTRFLVRSRAWQRWFALFVWLIHFAALVAFFITLVPII